MGRLLNQFIRAVTEAFFPARCLVCGTVFRPVQRPGAGITDRVIPGKFFAFPDGWKTAERKDTDPDPFREPVFAKLMAPFLCECCADDFLPAQSPMCPMCGMMFKSREGRDHLCETCIRSPRRFNMARAAGIYDRSFRTVIHRLKYGGKIQLARPLGRLLFATFLRFWDRGGIDRVVPVPLHTTRFRARGFNQAYLLVRQWPDFFKKTGDVPAGIRIDPRVLVRHRPTRPQTGLGKKRRVENIKNAFSLADGVDMTDQRVLLVDDVFTTGATAEECAEVLLKGGARQVDVLTLARAV